MKINPTAYLIMGVVVAPLLTAISQINVTHKDQLFPRKFIITGKTYGFKDSTILYLEYNGIKKSRDSAIVLNGHFVIKGVYPEKVVSERVILRTKDYSDYKYFWLDGENINFYGTKGNFNNAKITGSAAQQLSDEYSRLIEKEDQY